MSHTHTLQGHTLQLAACSTLGVHDSGCVCRHIYLDKFLVPWLSLPVMSASVHEPQLNVFYLILTITSECQCARGSTKHILPCSTNDITQLRNDSNLSFGCLRAGDGGEEATSVPTQPAH